MIISTIHNKDRAARILLVEDNRGDAILMQRAFKEIDTPCQISLAATGEEALAILRGDAGHRWPEIPDIILLDINLPQMGGLDVLKEIKSDAKLKHVPVIVLSSSRAEYDVARSYALHANSYVVKPADVESFGATVKKLGQFWFTAAVLPNSG